MPLLAHRQSRLFVEHYEQVSLCIISASSTPHAEKPASPPKLLLSTVLLNTISIKKTFCLLEITILFTRDGNMKNLIILFPYIHSIYTLNDSIYNSKAQKQKKQKIIIIIIIIPFTIFCLYTLLFKCLVSVRFFIQQESY